jgi:hypothetical protein
VHRHQAGCMPLQAGGCRGARDNRRDGRPADPANPCLAAQEQASGLQARLEAALGESLALRVERDGLARQLAEQAAGSSAAQEAEARGFQVTPDTLPARGKQARLSVLRVLPACDPATRPRCLLWCCAGACCPLPRELSGGQLGSRAELSVMQGAVCVVHGAPCSGASTDASCKAGGHPLQRKSIQVADSMAGMLYFGWSVVTCH